MNSVSNSDEPTQVPANKPESPPVGYASPPKHSQFKKGQSGNPKGKPPQKVIHLAVQDILNEKVTLMIDGQKVEMTKKEAVIQQMVNQSMKGKSAAMKNLIYLLKNLSWINPI